MLEVFGVPLSVHTRKVLVTALAPPGCREAGSC